MPFTKLLGFIIKDKNLIISLLLTITDEIEKNIPYITIFWEKGTAFVHFLNNLCSYFKLYKNKINIIKNPTISEGFEKLGGTS